MIGHILTVDVIGLVQEINGRRNTKTPVLIAAERASSNIIRI